MPKENLKVLVTEKESFIADAKNILQDAIKQDFESVLLVGIKDGQVYRTVSKQKSMVEAVGLIELAKAELINSW